jgi:5-methylcytosine-specific restriction endonuclease McrA
LDPYEKLENHHAFKVVGSFLEFTAEQRKAIKDANMNFYGNLTSDGSEKTLLEPLDSSEVANVDHIVPKSDGGSNFYFNAQVLPMDENIQKGGVKRGGKGKDDLDFEIGSRTLKEYYGWILRERRKRRRTPPRVSSEPRRAKYRREREKIGKQKREELFSKNRKLSQVSDDSDSDSD